MSDFSEKLIINSINFPKSVSENDNEWPNAKYQYVLVACARWEKKYIKEWIMYHKSIGFDHIYLYCNDDNPDDLYEEILPFVVGENSFVTFVHYKYKGMQYQMYFHYMYNYITESKWMMFLDIDEFLCLKECNDVSLFMKPYQDRYDAVYFNWCFYGNNGHKKRPDGWVLLNYTKREPGVTPFTKNIIRNKSLPYKQFFASMNLPIHHNPLSLDDTIRACNVIEESMNGYYENFPEKAWDYLKSGENRIKIIEKAYIAHFNMKSDEDFDLRLARGTQGAFVSAGIWAEKTLKEREDFHSMTNAVSDLYLHDYWYSILHAVDMKHAFKKSRWPLISHGKNATQISSFDDSDPKISASKLVLGDIIAYPQSHTKVEDFPWWQIDFGHICRIHEIVLFNRLDAAHERMAKFQFEVSNDDLTWEIIFQKTDGKIFGGVEGNPFHWVSDSGVSSRFLRVTVLGENTYFHLSQVEVYGEDLS